jgi:hypothetical protein
MVKAIMAVEKTKAKLGSMARKAAPVAGLAEGAAVDSAGGLAASPVSSLVSSSRRTRFKMPASIFPSALACWLVPCDPPTS